MYRVSLDMFEGPMDLLLFFIRRDELDIYDIPIARIADEYLGYVRILEVIDLDRAGDFIYMAALLISIKARMLLPSNESSEEDAEPFDPRQELVERLLEYVRYKKATELLGGYNERRLERFTRPAAAVTGLTLNVEHEEWVNTGVFDLIRALRRVLTEAPDEPLHAVQRVDYTVEEQQVYLANELRGRGAFGFRAMARGRTKPFVIATFLAILELARRGAAIILADEEPDDFVVSPGDMLDKDGGVLDDTYTEAA